MMLLCVSGFFVDAHPQMNAYIFHFIVDTYRFEYLQNRGVEKSVIDRFRTEKVIYQYVANESLLKL